MFSRGEGRKCCKYHQMVPPPLQKLVSGMAQIGGTLFKNGIIDDARTLILRNISFYSTSPPKKGGDAWVYLSHSAVFDQDLCPITSCNMFPQAQRDVLMLRANSSHTAKSDNAAKDNVQKGPVHGLGIVCKDWQYILLVVD